jgi:hypothetical protein
MGQPLCSSEGPRIPLGIARMFVLLISPRKPEKRSVQGGLWTLEGRVGFEPTTPGLKGTD